MSYALLLLALVAIDQLVKLWVRAHIPLGTSLPFIPHLFDLAYVQNTGAAFSLLHAHTWLLTLVSALVALGIVVLLVKKVVHHPFGVLSLTVVLAGAVGNLIDRLAFGFVTDMFEFLPFRFAIFNVADICVVLGGIAFCLYIFFFMDKYENKGAAHDADTAEG